MAPNDLSRTTNTTSVAFGMRPAVMGDTADELRADPVSHRKTEHREEDRFDLIRDVDAQLADQHTREQRSCDRAETETSQFNGADPVPDRKRQEHWERGIHLQRGDDPNVAVLRRIARPGRRRLLLWGACPGAPARCGGLDTLLLRRPASGRPRGVTR